MRSNDLKFYEDPMNIQYSTLSTGLVEGHTNTVGEQESCRVTMVTMKVCHNGEYWTGAGVSQQWGLIREQGGGIATVPIWDPLSRPFLHSTLGAHRRQDQHVVE